MDPSTVSSTLPSSNESIPESQRVESDKAARPKFNPPCSVHGVRLKHFEQVLLKLLPSIQPNYVCLPPLPPLSSHHHEYSPQWPFDRLPSSVRVCGNNPGQLSQQSRAERKEQQLRSMLRCILQFIPQSHDNTKKEPFTIVDFGGGSGHLGIPLALLVPHCRIVVVDLAKRTLDLMHQKAAMVIQEIQQLQQEHDNSATPMVPDYQSTLPLPSWLDDNPAFYSCGKNGILQNLFSFHGAVDRYNQALDMAVALHLCGEATDVTLRKAGCENATAMVLAPCCVGKLSRQVRNPNVFHATGQHGRTLSYPQSTLFCQLLSHQDQDATNTTTTATATPTTAANTNDWDALAKAADYSNEQEARTSRNASRRTAKAVLETDRRLYLEETFQYKTALMRMDPWEATPKNDILVAWHPHQIPVVGFDDNIFSIPDEDAMVDLGIVNRQLLLPTDPRNTTCHNTTVVESTSDWTRAEEQELEQQIQEFLDRTANMEDKVDQVYTFPTRMGGRKRKLIHFIADRMDLDHWSVGEKDSERTVAISRSG